MAKKEKNIELETEFDLLADNYYSQHKENIVITGEAPEYFSKYKVADFANFFCRDHHPDSILDFGCGIGNSIEFFRVYFPKSMIYCADVSARSIAISKYRFPGKEIYIRIYNLLPVSDESFDAIFTACVFHHIPHNEHQKWLLELRRVLRPGGVLAIYEHNPLNPLTVYAVNNCPIDINAKLIKAKAMKQMLIENGWSDVTIEYKLFFPNILKFLRPFEKFLCKLFLGAQWRIIAKK